MDEVLCIFYIIEMLYMLENFYKVGFIYGDFKFDNLFICSSRCSFIYFYIMGLFFWKIWDWFWYLILSFEEDIFWN